MKFCTLDDGAKRNYHFAEVEEDSDDEEDDEFDSDGRRKQKEEKIGGTFEQRCC